MWPESVFLCPPVHYTLSVAEGRAGERLTLGEKRCPPMSTDVHRYINNNNNMKKIFLKNLDGDLVSLDYVKRITFHKENYLMLDRNGGQL